jgi:glycosyltransferase involved in cell wall biosynthesis
MGQGTILERPPQQKTFESLDVLLVDPSLYTAPYDAALNEGLLQAHVRPLWAVRPLRPGDRQEIPAPYVDDFFYRHSDVATALPAALRALAKGIEHAWGLLQFIAKVWMRRPQVVHVQWVVIPLLDVIAFWLIRWRSPVVLTVHDTVPTNGQRLTLLQDAGFDVPMRLADAIIVHTQTGRQRLIERGVSPLKIDVIPHGPLPLWERPARPRSATDPRWTFVLFGEIKPYKGLDLLIEAMALIDESLRLKCRVIVAGRPRMDIAPLLQRIRKLKLEGVFDVRPRRQSEQEMADLFEEADCFVMPYRQIDASGVYYLVQSRHRWLITSHVGVFAESLQVPGEGQFVQPGDIHSLKVALEYAIRVRPKPSVDANADSWGSIGWATRSVYERVLKRDNSPVTSVTRPDDQASKG